MSGKTYAYGAWKLSGHVPHMRMPRALVLVLATRTGIDDFVSSWDVVQDRYPEPAPGHRPAGGAQADREAAPGHRHTGQETAPG